MRGLAGALLLLLGVACTDAPTVVCFGDSTTAWRGPELNWTVLLEQALADEIPDLRVVNAGVSSEDTERARRRFPWAVLRHRPRVVTVLFGINDAAVDLHEGRSTPRVPLDRYRANLRHFVRRLREAGARVILMTPNPLRWEPWLRERFGAPPYDPEDPRGLNVVLDDYVRAVRELAAEEDVPLVDLHAAFEAAPGSVGDLLMDGMHPNDAGHRLVAREVAGPVRAALESP